MAELDTPTDALPLLALKIAPRQFDLSYRFASISLRDQMVRGQTLIRTLIDMKLVQASAPESGTNFQLLICGAGAAGLAAAKEAHDHGISFVLIEKNAGAPGGVLTSPAPRFVSTGMYEWPHPNHAKHDFPVSTPILLGADSPPMPTLRLNFAKPVKIATFGAALGRLLRPHLANWRQQFHACVSGKLRGNRSLFADQTVLDDGTKKALRAMLDDKVSIHGVPLHDATLPLIQLQCLSGKRLTIPPFQFQYVIYAVGFAKEVVTYGYGKDKTPYEGYEHTPFWDRDAVQTTWLGFGQPPRVAILGSGDGALQDAMRCLVRSEVPHPLAVWDDLMDCQQPGQRRLRSSTHVKVAMAALAAADGYTTGGAIWTHRTHIFKSLDVAFQAIVDNLLLAEGPKLRTAVNLLIRDDVQKVTLVNRDGHFTKAYALNRFLVLLIATVLKEADSPHRHKLELLSGEVIAFEAMGFSPRGALLRIEMQKAGGVTVVKVLECELVVLRGGLDHGGAPSQLGGLSGIDTGRVGLGRIPPSIRPVGLA